MRGDVGLRVGYILVVCELVPGPHVDQEKVAWLRTVLLLVGHPVPADLVGDLALWKAGADIRVVGHPGTHATGVLSDALKKNEPNNQAPSELPGTRKDFANQCFSIPIKPGFRYFSTKVGDPKSKNTLQKRKKLLFLLCYLFYGLFQTYLSPLLSTIYLELHLKRPHLHHVVLLDVVDAVVKVVVGTDLLARVVRLLDHAHVQEVDLVLHALAQLHDVAHAPVRVVVLVLPVDVLLGLRATIYEDQGSFSNSTRKGSA